MTIAAAFIMPHPPVIIPEVGKGQEKEIQRTIDAFREVAREIAEMKPDTIVVISPHSTAYEHYFHISPGKAATGNFGRFGAREVEIHAEYDEEFGKYLSKEAYKQGINAGTLGERERLLDHGTMIPLYFIQKEFRDFKVLRIGLSGASPEDHQRLGALIVRAAAELGRRIVLVASGDLSHKLKPEGPYGFAEEGPRFDERILEIIGENKLEELIELDPALCQNAAECGLGSFWIMSGALKGRKTENKVLSYEGPFGVGYCVASLLVQRSARDLDPYLKLARLSLESFIGEGRRLTLADVMVRFPDLPGPLTHQKAGVFVSLKKNGALRGCIGTIYPVTECTAEEILRNAISAAMEDPRFPPVGKEELKELDYSVDVLLAPEPIQSPAELDVKRYGVIVTSGRKRGLLLPNLDNVNTVEEQIHIARAKAGISPGEEVSLQRFEVIRHH